MSVYTQKSIRRTRRPVARPKTGETPIQHVRIPSDEWEAFKSAAHRRHVRVLREFIRWYLRWPGAKLPARPAPSADGNGGSEGADE